MPVTAAVSRPRLAHTRRRRPRAVCVDVGRDARALVHRRERRLVGNERLARIGACGGAHLCRGAGAHQLAAALAAFGTEI
ncbi:MAG TPA: hypothetical protein VED45_10275, partial [Steroidobacteraceae bacterium]|nr:hypothetical protein [Steroidobacteraceae bacterium]